MSDEDKNQHLSPILSEIQDYGPAGSDDEIVDESELPPEADLDDDGEEWLEQAPPPTAAQRGVPAWVSGLLAVLVIGVLAFVFLLERRLSGLEAEIVEIPRVPGASLMSPAPHEHTPDPEIALLREQLLAVEEELRALGEQFATLRSAPAATPAPAAPAETGVESSGTAQAPATATATAAPAPQPAQAAPGWYINLSSFARRDTAEQWSLSLKDGPRPFDILPVESGDSTYYRVRLGPFDERDEARAAMVRVADRWGIEGAWVSRD